MSPSSVQDFHADTISELKGNSIKILGIDPGVATLGWGMLEVRVDEGLHCKCIDYGVITTPKEDSQPVRLVELKQDMSEVLIEYTPDIVSVEKLFFCRNQKTAVAVGEARGVVLLSIGEFGCKAVEYTPLQVKSLVCGNGKAKKREVQETVQRILGLKEIPKPDDAADGLALALCLAQDYYYSVLGKCAS